MHSASIDMRPPEAMRSNMRGPQSGKRFDKGILVPSAGFAKITTMTARTCPLDMRAKRAFAQQQLKRQMPESKVRSPEPPALFHGESLEKARRGGVIREHHHRDERRKEHERQKNDHDGLRVPAKPRVEFPEDVLQKRESPTRRRGGRVRADAI